MNNKGFTLVEVLATIAILILIGTIALPSLSGMFSKQETKNSDRIKENLINAAEAYVQISDKSISDIYNKYNCISVSTLINRGVISSKDVQEYVDYNTHEDYIRVCPKNNEPYQYTYIESKNINQCSSCP